MTTEKSIGEISYEVGFTSPAYFTKCYKDEYGETPKESRR
jgi:AraC-like DNA-binding protein